MKKVFYGVGSFFVLTAAITITNVFNVSAQTMKPEAKACYCNIGGYCETGGNMGVCGFVAGGAGGYWCGVASGNCTDQSGPSNPSTPIKKLENTIAKSRP